MMVQSLSINDIKPMSLLDDISLKTVGGSPCVVLVRTDVGDKPLIGAYWSGDSWIACQWTAGGRFINDDHPRKLDIDIELETKGAA